MPTHALLDQLLHNSLDLVENLRGHLWLEFNELLQSHLVTIFISCLKKYKVLAVERLHHFSAMLLIISGDRVDILDNVRGMLVHNQLRDLRVNLGSEVCLLLGFWRVVVRLLCQIE